MLPIFSKLEEMIPIFSKLEEMIDKTVDAVVYTVNSIGASISEFFTAPVTDSHPPPHPPPPPPPPPPSVIKIVYLYGKWNPPYDQILHTNPDFTVFEFDIRINHSNFYYSTPPHWCFRCRNTVPGCNNCQRQGRPRISRSWEEVARLYENAKQDAKLEIATMMNNIQRFRDACKMSRKAVLQNLSYLHFLRMVRKREKEDPRDLLFPSFKFSDFDGFFKKCINVYPVSQQLKDTGMQCQINSCFLTLYVQFPNSWERIYTNSREIIYPEFENVSTRNELLALSMSMRTRYLLVSTDYMHQSRRNKLLMRTLIANRISSRIIARKLVPAALKK